MLHTLARIGEMIHVGFRAGADIDAGGELFGCKAGEK